MKKEKVVVERGTDNRFSAYMVSCDYDFGLAGYGATAKEAIADFYQSYEEEKRLYSAEKKEFPNIQFDIQYDVCAFLDFYTGVLSKSGLEKVTGIHQKQ
ncbi:MAG: DNA-binding protein, partial [Bacteroidales bacterium]|nr:DNA-binding protein [Bacteroidales bacterium]